MVPDGLKPVGYESGDECRDERGNESSDERSDESSSEDAMAVVRVFSSEIEAEIAMSALEAAGIECVMRRDDCGGVQPAMGLTAGIQMVVPDEDLDAATEVLDAPAEDAEDGEGGDGDLEN